MGGAMTVSLRALGLLVALNFSCTAWANESGPDIVVTGSGLDDTPATPAYDVQTIGRERLRTVASGRIEDALASVAGFQQFRRSDSRSSNPSAQGVTLRALGGNATSRALVLLDGVPMADPLFGYVPLPALSPERLASARVTRGGGAGAFGAGAVAGTIELSSADARTLGLLSASALASQRGESEISATLAPELGQGFAVASARWDRGRGFWTTPVGQRDPLSARARYESWSASLRAVAPIMDSVELQGRVLAFDDRRTLRFAGADSTSSGQDASLRLVGRGDWQFDVLGYVQARDFSNIVISSDTSAAFRKSLDQHSTPSTGLGGKLELRPPIGKNHVLRLGADWRRVRADLREDVYSTLSGQIVRRRAAGGRTDDIGLFAEHDWTLGALVLTAGARADRWTIRDGYLREVAATSPVDNHYPDRSGWDASLRGGAVWQAGGGLSLRAAAYTGLRLPTLNELYRPFRVGDVTTRANADLVNERLRGFDLGVDYAPSDAVSLSLTVFDNRVRNAVANVTIGTNLRQRRNVDAIHSKGVEGSVNLRRGAFGLDGSLALTRARVRASGVSVLLDGKRPAQTPALAASATLSWRPDTDIVVSASLRHTGVQFEDDLETDGLPAATTLDAYAELPLGRGFAVVLRAENLWNERIVTRNQAGSIDLGASRTVWIGIRIGN